MDGPPGRRTVTARTRDAAAGAFVMQVNVLRKDT